MGLCHPGPTRWCTSRLFVLAAGAPPPIGKRRRHSRKRINRMRILYRDREAWVDLSEEPEGTDHEPWEREALQGFTVALPNAPKEIEVSEGRAFYWLRQTGVCPYED